MFIEISTKGNKYCYKDYKLRITHNSYGCSFSDACYYKSYHINNELHNELGPAFIYGNIFNNSYYLKNKLYTYDEWKSIICEMDE